MTTHRTIVDLVTTHGDYWQSYYPSAVIHDYSATRLADVRAYADMCYWARLIARGDHALARYARAAIVEVC